MKIIVQRVAGGSVTIGDLPPKTIATGLVALVGFAGSDDEKTVDYMVGKLINLRIFEDENENMNLSLLDVFGELLVVPNFTLYANCKKGRRPSFVGAAHPDIASPLFTYMVDKLGGIVDTRVEAGRFGADMRVEISNDGPVTIILDSDELMPK